MDRHLQVPVYEVVNVNGDQASGIGFWSPASGLSKLLNSSTGHGQTKLSIDAGVIQCPGGSKIVPKGWDIPVNGKILQIGVPIRHDFKLFVSVDTIPGTNTMSVSGYSIDVFEAAVKKLPYALRYNYVPFDCANSYDKLVAKVYLKVSSFYSTYYLLTFPIPFLSLVLKYCPFHIYFFFLSLVYV